MMKGTDITNRIWHKMDKAQLIEKFYTAFANGDSETMSKCYHDDIVFEDPAFGILKGARASSMWKMLLSQKNSDMDVKFYNVKADGKSGEAEWVAKYIYGDKRKKVINKVHAHFEFKDGKIIKHTDTFNLWKWTKQAMGLSGYLLGWTPFMKSKIQATANKKLDKFMAKNN